MAILISKKFKFSATEIIADKNGTYLIVAGTLFQLKVLIVNVYAHNFDDTEFSNRLAIYFI